MICIFGFSVYAQQKSRDTIYYPKEEDYYHLQSLEIPQDIVLEVSGLALLPNDKLAVCTRRGEVWIISNPYKKGGTSPSYFLFARGLHEPLGLAYHQDDLYVTQRQELTRLRDFDGDNRADEYKTIHTFQLTGNYHEYAYGPVFDKEGNMIVTLNLGWIGGQMVSKVKWRGWMVKITPDGELFPIAAGMRSPAGLTIDGKGNLYYSENQGGWIGSGWFNEVEIGDFVGHPASLVWSSEENSPVNLEVDDIPDTGSPMFEVAKSVEGLKSPTVYIPHAVLGVSTSDILPLEENFMGPYKGQFLIGDQGQSIINRIFVEEVNGVKQGVVFPFLSGFSSGVMRLELGRDGSLFVGMTARGWGSIGGELYGLQRVIWNGDVPFEMKAVRAQSDGFEIEFTHPVDIATARDVASYQMRSFTYKYHHNYGSPIIDSKYAKIKAIEISPDRMKVRLVLDEMKLGYIYEVSLPGIASHDRSALLHSVGYYTLTELPKMRKLMITSDNRVIPNDVTLSNADVKLVGPSSGEGIEKNDKVENIELLLNKYTCISCHHKSDKRVGPSFANIAKRNYSIDKLIDLIKKPQPSNWPEFATPMPPMSHIPDHDLEKIAKWIRSLEQ
ncbi:hypothetical protein GCM10025777_29700 [Membranihabitans marinus]